MSRIKGKDTKPEILVRKYLFSNGFRYRVNVKNLPGKPDIVLVSLKTAIMVHGCFWHGHSKCKLFVIPKTRTEWWLNKITANKRNDVTKKRVLRNAGWKVLTVWACQLSPKKRENTLDALKSKLLQGNEKEKSKD